MEEDENEKEEEKEEESDDDAGEEDYEESDDAADEDDNEDESVAVTSEMFAEWSRGATKKSPAALKHLLLAFRAIVRSDETAASCRYRVDSRKGKAGMCSPKIFMQYDSLQTTC